MANGMNQLIKYEKTNTGLRVQEESTIILGIDISGPHYQKQGSPVALDTWAHHHWNTFESLRASPWETSTGTKINRSSRRHKWRGLLIQIGYKCSTGLAEQ
jgi:hypothetical protein